jgi:hypothetical protein
MCPHKTTYSGTAEEVFRHDRTVDSSEIPTQPCRRNPLGVCSRPCLGCAIVDGRLDRSHAPAAKPAKNHTCCQGDAPLSGIDYTKLPWPIYFLIQGEDWDGTNAMFMILTVALVSRILLTDVMELCPWRSGACKHLVGEGVSMPVSSGCCWGFPSPPVNRVSLAFFESYRNV